MLKNSYFANNPAQITTTWFIQKDKMIDENNGIDIKTKNSQAKFSLNALLFADYPNKIGCGAAVKAIPNF